MIISRTPLRLSFFGGGTDYPDYFLRHGGAILGSAIGKYSFITANRFPSKLFDYSLRVSYRKVELVKDIGEVEHRVYRECLKYCGLESDIELHNIADLPAFTGLGSSSSFTVGLLKVLYAFKGQSLSAQELGYRAIEMEQQILQEHVGCQDQMLAAVGGLNLIEFHQLDDIRVTPVHLSAERLRELESHLMLLFTKITRRADEVASDQLRQLDKNLDTLRRMRAMVDEGLALLTGSGDLRAFGRLLHESWMLKHQLSDRITTPAINALYQRGLDHGAIGGKLLGAGGGGFIMFFVPPDQQTALRNAFPDFEIIDVSLAAPGASIIFES